jgi:hypothetical protein
MSRHVLEKEIKSNKKSGDEIGTKWKDELIARSDLRIETISTTYHADSQDVRRRGRLLQIHPNF